MQKAGGRILVHCPAALVHNASACGGGAHFGCRWFSRVRFDELMYCSAQVINIVSTVRADGDADDSVCTRVILIDNTHGRGDRANGISPEIGKTIIYDAHFQVQAPTNK